MRFRNISALKEKSSLEPRFVEHELEKSLEKKEIMFNDTTDNFGWELNEIFKEAGTSLLEATSILDDIEVPRTGKNFDLLSKVTVLGDGNCPICGGDTEFDDVSNTFTCKVCDHAFIL